MVAVGSGKVCLFVVVVVVVVIVVFFFVFYGVAGFLFSDDLFWIRDAVLVLGMCAVCVCFS